MTPLLCAVPYIAGALLPLAVHAQSIRSERTIALDAALEAASAAQTRCRKDGIDHIAKSLGTSP